MDDDHVEDVEDFLNSYAPEHDGHEQAQTDPIVITDEDHVDSRSHTEFEGIYQADEDDVHIIESESEIQGPGQEETNDGEEEEKGEEYVGSDVGSVGQGSREGEEEGGEEGGEEEEEDGVADDEFVETHSGTVNATPDVIVIDDSDTEHEAHASQPVDIPKHADGIHALAKEVEHDNMVDSEENGASEVAKDEDSTTGADQLGGAKMDTDASEQAVVASESDAGMEPESTSAQAMEPESTSAQAMEPTPEPANSEADTPKKSIFNLSATPFQPAAFGIQPPFGTAVFPFGTAGTAAGSDKVQSVFGSTSRPERTFGPFRPATFDSVPLETSATIQPASVFGSPSATAASVSAGSSPSGSAVFPAFSFQATPSGTGSTFNASLFGGATALPSFAIGSSAAASSPFGVAPSNAIGGFANPSNPSPGFAFGGSSWPATTSTSVTLNLGENAKPSGPTTVDAIKPMHASENDAQKPETMNLAETDAGSKEEGSVEAEDLSEKVAQDDKASPVPDQPSTNETDDTKLAASSNLGTAFVFKGAGTADTTFSFPVPSSSFAPAKPADPSVVQCAPFVFTPNKVAELSNESNPFAALVQNRAETPKDDKKDSLDDDNKINELEYDGSPVETLPDSGHMDGLQDAREEPEPEVREVIREDLTPRIGKVVSGGKSDKVGSGIVRIVRYVDNRAGMQFAFNESGASLPHVLVDQNSVFTRLKEKSVFVKNKEGRGLLTIQYSLPETVDEVLSLLTGLLAESDQARDAEVVKVPLPTVAAAPIVDVKASPIPKKMAPKRLSAEAQALRDKLLKQKMELKRLQQKKEAIKISSASSAPPQVAATVVEQEESASKHVEAEAGEILEDKAPAQAIVGIDTPSDLKEALVEADTAGAIPMEVDQAKAFMVSDLPAEGTSKPSSVAKMGTDPFVPLDEPQLQPQTPPAVSVVSSFATILPTHLPTPAAVGHIGERKVESERQEKPSSSIFPTVVHGMHPNISFPHFPASVPKELDATQIRSPMREIAAPAFGTTASQSFSSGMPFERMVPRIPTSPIPTKLVPPPIAPTSPSGFTPTKMDISTLNRHVPIAVALELDEQSLQQTASAFLNKESQRLRELEAEVAKLKQERDTAKSIAFSKLAEDKHSKEVEALEKKHKASEVALESKVNDLTKRLAASIPKVEAEKAAQDAIHNLNAKLKNHCEQVVHALKRKRHREENTQLLTALENHCRPWSREDFEARLKTFHPLTWTGKPESINAVQCARRGWFNVGYNRLRSTDGMQIVYNFNASSLDEENQRVADLLSGPGHDLLSGWIGNICPKSFGQYPDASSEVKLFEQLHDELRVLEALQLSLRVHSKTKQALGLILDKLTDKFSANKHQQEVAVLVCCGWSAKTVKASDHFEAAVENTLCCRLCGIELLLDDLEKEIEFDSLGEHRTFCCLSRKEGCEVYARILCSDKSQLELADAAKLNPDVGISPRPTRQDAVVMDQDELLLSAEGDPGVAVEQSDSEQSAKRVRLV